MVESPLLESPNAGTAPTPREAQLQELDLKITVSLRLLGHFASLHRRWPANRVYLELIEGLEVHLEYWDHKREALRREAEAG